MLDLKTSSPRQKHEMVRELLTEGLRRGEFVVGRRLPGDKDLAARFGVSYMTARKAVNELVEASLLERRIGDGTYVREGSQQRLSTRTLNLICTAYEGSTVKSFLQLAGHAAQKRGWRAHVIRIHRDHELGALRAIENGELSLVLADDSFLKGNLSKAINKANGRTVLLGWKADHPGVPSVLADDTHAVQLAVGCLQSYGHRNIALLCNDPSSANEKVQINVWNSLLPHTTDAMKRKQWLICANTPRFECASRFAYQAVSRWLHTVNEDREVQALISTSDELAIGALCACRDHDFPVPQALSLVNISDSAVMQFFNPRVTCVDIDLESHILNALENLEAVLRGEGATLDFQLIVPRLIERESVAQVR